MTRLALTAPELAKQQAAMKRAKDFTKPFGDDEKLDSWAARMVAAADEFTNNKRSDPLGGFLLR